MIHPSDEGKEFKVTIHLVNGDAFEVYGMVPAEDLTEVYQCLNTPEGRIKFPTAPDTMHFLPATSVLRIEAVGDFD